MKYQNYNILKRLCRITFISGSGSFWYEYDEQLNDESVLYKLYSGFFLTLYMLMTVIEIVGVFFSELPEDEASDCLTFSVSHTIVLFKILSVMRRRGFIKSLNRRIIRACEQFEENEVMERKYRILMYFLQGYFWNIYITTFFYVFEGLRKLFSGLHFITIVTYYPAYEDNSVPAILFRVLTTVILFVMMLTMVSIDSFALTHLVIIKYKFITLRHYFNNIRKDFDKANINGSGNVAAEKLYDGIRMGIVMHSEVLKLCKDVDEAFGTVLALQLFLSSGSAVSLLLQLAFMNNLTFTAATKLCLYIIAVFFMLGLFLCSAGEITYEASRIDHALFNCGWHLCVHTPYGQKSSKLVLQASMQAQRPVILKAFKMVHLTYGTFISVVRGTYSVFALIQAQGKPEP